MTKSITLPEDVLREAHLPALVMSLTHLVGDASLLKPEWRPTYNPLVRDDIGVAPEEQDNIRRTACDLLSRYLAGEISPRPLGSDLVRQMIDFITGAEIPEGYDAFLMDELALEGASSKDPRFEAPDLKSAASRLKVLVIGAGMSGLLTGIRLSQAGVPFEIVEKNPDVGGTWYENTYPGCRVDSSNHMYSYSFEPNHSWPQHFSTQPVLLDYFRKVADKYDLRRFIRFETTVDEMVWDEAKAVWRVSLRDGSGSLRQVEANAVVTAVGQLNRPRIPDIKGIESFKGPAFHSARWRHDVDLSGKRVCVIGTGASAFQFVPEIAPKVASLTIFQRTPPWAFPAEHYHQDVPEGVKWLLENAPFYDKWYRFYLFWAATDGFLPGVRADPDWQGPSIAVGAENLALREQMAEALSAQAADRPDLLEKIIPTYPLGGKRALLDNGVWVSALKRDNVDLCVEPIQEITAEGVVTADGVLHPADVLIYGTGFHASRFLWPIRIKGRDGRDLHETWAGDPRAYLGMTTPGFPNLFMIYGPNTNIVVNGSIIFFSECSVRYIVGCLKMLAETGSSALEPRQDVHDAFNRRVDEANRLMAWGSPQVTSWYKNEAGRVTQNWPFALVDYWQATLAPDPEDFVLTRRRELVEQG